MSLNAGETTTTADMLSESSGEKDKLIVEKKECETQTTPVIVTLEPILTVQTTPSVNNNVTIDLRKTSLTSPKEDSSGKEKTKKQEEDASSSSDDDEDDEDDAASSAASTTSSESRRQRSNNTIMCRICHCEETSEEYLIAPCYCSGTLRYVHQSCLQQWLKSNYLSP